MSFDLTASMREALNATRAGNPAEATRLIQDALTGVTGSSAAKSAQVQSGLMDTLRQRFEMPQSTAHEPDGVDDAGWLARSHTEAAGTLAYRLYVPSETPRGLIVMLHGCTQNSEDFALGTGMNAVAEANGLLVAYPQQPKSANAHACWNWFELGHQGRDAGEPSILAGIVRALSEEYDVPPKRVMVAGLSAGGAMAAVMAQAYPDLIGAVGVHSGLASGAARDVASAFSAMRAPMAAPSGSSDVPCFIIHGNADSTVHPGNAAMLSEAIGFDGHRLQEETVVAGGRSVEMTSAFTPDGALRHERWIIDGAGHAWSGGNASGSFADAKGPDASAQMVRFFEAVVGG